MQDVIRCTRDLKCRRYSEDVSDKIRIIRSYKEIYEDGSIFTDI